MPVKMQSFLDFKGEMTRETFLEKSKNKDFKNMFNEVPVKKGDFINITPEWFMQVLKEVSSL